ncbi:MAG: ATP-grasp domain-containing protein [Deltaproteobacteria bacterium]|nr:ATP-grasp domain-containing protein [Deltaproteobacteria bacterium]
MRVAVIHDRIPEGRASPDHMDVLAQADAVSQALRELGHEPVTITVSLDLHALLGELARVRPSLVFNLVESVEGHGRLIHLPPALLDCLKVPYTGARTDALYATTNKPATKKALMGAAIPTPPWFSSRKRKASLPFSRGLYIIKSVWEHASIGLEEDSVVAGEDPEQLLAMVRRKEDVMGQECFAEAYIEGREFNLSLLAAGADPQLLPPAEIRFVDFPDTKRKIVGYRAKWHEESFEYLHTVRTFDFPPEDRGLLRFISEIALKCWSLFELRGYARVDFRVDADGGPWVLEVNVNPCLSPEAGFAAAAARAGLTFRHIVERIIEDR